MLFNITRICFALVIIFSSCQKADPVTAPKETAESRSLSKKGLTLLQSTVWVNPRNKVEFTLSYEELSPGDRELVLREGGEVSVRIKRGENPFAKPAFGELDALGSKSSGFSWHPNTPQLNVQVSTSTAIAPGLPGKDEMQRLFDKAFEALDKAVSKGVETDLLKVLEAARAEGGQQQWTF